MIPLNTFSLLALLLSSFLASGRLFRRLGLNASREPLAVAIAGLTLWIAWPVITTLLVASAAMITGMPLVRMPIIAALSIAGALVLLALGDVPTQTIRNTSDDTLRRSLRRIWPGWTLFFFVVFPAIGLHIILFITSLLRPPMASDGVYYHLPLIGQWLRAGQLHIVAGVWAYGMPGNGEVWQLFFASIGIERLIEPAMLPLGILCALIVAGLGRALGASIRAALICSCMVMVSPMVALQCYGSYVDLFSAAFLLGSCYWILRLSRYTTDVRQVRGSTAMAGLSFGMALGSRLMVLGWAAPIVLSFLLARRIESSVFSKTMLRRATLFVLCSLIGSTYWYARNGAKTGWPLYPVSIQIFGHHLGAGLSAPEMCSDLSVRDWTSLKYPWVESKKHGYSYSVDNGLGVVFAACAVPGMVYLLIRRTRLTRRHHRFEDGVVLLFFAVGLVLFVNVFFSYARYALPIWVMAFAAAGPLWSLLIRYRWRTGVILLGSATWLSAAMIVLWPVKNLLGQIQAGDLSRLAWYELPKSLDRLPPRTVILNMADGAANYALSGEDWRNEVIDTFMAKSYGLAVPLRRSELDAQGIEIVVASDKEDPAELFGSDVSYQELPDEAGDAFKADQIHARAYRILRVIDDRTLASIQN